MNRLNRILLLILLVAAMALLGGCGLLFGGGAEPTPAPSDESRALVPTWTPTVATAPSTPTPTLSFVEGPVGEPQVAAIAPAAPVTQTTAGGTGIAAAAVVTASAATTAAVPAATAALRPTAAAPRPKLIIEQDLANVRTGPGTNYGLGGTATKGQEFDILSKDATGQWWQVCCVNGEPVWVFGQLARVENAESVAVGESLAQAPAAPAAAPVAAEPAPAQPEPTATPAPAAPAAPPADDPCAGIGGDGCKFKLRGGPSFTANGGGELKLTLGFIHSGEGDQPQSSYFVVLLKDGQNLGVPDSVRSYSPANNGPNGPYNYEYKIPADKIPGGVAGNYTIWVLDGNGERDSQSFSFTVPDGQGEVWIKFDQA